LVCGLLGGFRRGWGCGCGFFGFQEGGLKVAARSFLVEEWIEVLLGFFEPVEVVEAPLGHVAEGGEVHADHGVTFGGGGIDGDFVDDVAVGFAGTGVVAEAFEAEADLVDRGTAPIRGVVEFGEFLIDGKGPECVAGLVEFVGDFVSSFALPVGPDGGFFLAKFTAGLEELDGFLHGFLFSAKGAEGLHAEILGLWGKGAGGVGGKEAFSACEGVCKLAGEVGDVSGTEGNFAGFGLCHFHELQARIEFGSGLVVAGGKVRMRDLHFCPQ